MLSNIEHYEAMSRTMLTSIRATILIIFLTVLKTISNNIEQLQYQTIFTNTLDNDENNITDTAEQFVMMYCPSISLTILRSIVDNSEQCETNFVVNRTQHCPCCQYKIILVNIFNIFEYLYEIAIVWFADVEPESNL